MYCTIEDLQGEGVEVTEANRPRLLSLIAAAGEKIDLWTDQFFEEREMTFAFCGHGGRTLHLSVPAVSLSEVKINGKPVPLDDILILGNGRYLSREQRWSCGYFNIAVKGRFGVVVSSTDENGNEVKKTPAAIREAAIRLVIRNMAMLGDAEAQEERKRNRITSETTDGHSYQLEASGSSSSMWSGDAEIDALLYPFCAAVRMTVI